MSRIPRRAAILATAALTLLATLALAPAASATFPDRNGRIAFQAQTDHGVQIFTVRPNGRDLRQITHVDGEATAPDWSPDGRRIAFTLNECSVAIMDADGSDLSLIADDPSMCQSDPSFTPDGIRLVFGHFDWLGTGLRRNLEHEARRDRQAGRHRRGRDRPERVARWPEAELQGRARRRAFVQNMDGGGLVQVSPSVSVAYKSDWAPNGQRLVYSENSEPGPGDAVNIVTVRPDGTDSRNLTHYPAPLLAWVGGYSPDGQWIVFRLEDHGVFTLYRIRPDGSDLHAILSPSSTFRPRSIDWGPAAHR